MKERSVVSLELVDQVLHHFIYFVLFAFNCAVFVTVLVCDNVKDVKVLWNRLRDVKLYVINSLTMINIHISKALYISWNDNRTYDV